MNDVELMKFIKDNTTIVFDEENQVFKYTLEYPVEDREPYSVQVMVTPNEKQQMAGYNIDIESHIYRVIYDNVQSMLRISGEI